MREAVEREQEKSPEDELLDRTLQETNTRAKHMSMLAARTGSLIKAVSEHSAELARVGASLAQVCTALHCAVLSCAVLCCTVLYCTACDLLVICIHPCVPFSILPLTCLINTI